MTLFFQRAAGAALLLAVSACSILPKSEPLAVYRLPTLAASATSAAPAAPAARLRALRVATPYANRTIDSERILVVPEGDVIKSYAGVRWSDPAPVLLRDRLLEALTVDGRFTELSGDNANIAADIELNGSLMSFQTEYRDGVATVVVQFDARLVESATRQQLALHRFSVAQPASGTKVPEIVNAYGAAVNALSVQVASWAANLPQARAQQRR